MPLYLSMDQHISLSEMIAVVEIIDVTELPDPYDARPRSMYQPQSATAEVVAVLKGNMEKRIVILNEQRHVCDRATLRPGRFLVFLRRKEQKVVLTNGRHSLRPIQGENVEWLGFNTNEPPVITYFERPLARLTNEIHSIVIQKREHPMKGSQPAPAHVPSKGAGDGSL